MDRSFDEIVQEAQSVLTNLQKKETQINDEMQEIRDAAPPPPFSAEVKKKLHERGDELADVLALIKQTADVTVLKLDKSSDLEKVADALDAITAQLQAKLAHLKAIGGGAQTAGNVLAQVDGLITKAKGFVDKTKAPKAPAGKARYTSNFDMTP